MFAVVWRLRVPEGGTVEQGRRLLNGEVLGRVKQGPGFVTGYWLAPAATREALSVVIYRDEPLVLAAPERVRSAVPERVQLLDVKVREVTASA